jgi:ATP-dependent exoDNAse (exonuclease V) beta subunit
MVGSAVHRVLEIFDLAAEPAAELARQRERLGAHLGQHALPEELPATLAAAREVLDGLREGKLLRRLRALAPHVVARELPLLLPPTDQQTGAVGFVSGAIDLLYRDPADGRLVVADFKTGSEGEAEELVAAYRRQGSHYVEAVRQALGLEQAPRFELWFLERDEIVEVEARGAG